MTDQVLDILKWALLALLYLFFARVLWAVWSEVKGPRPGQVPAGAGMRTAAPDDLTQPAVFPGSGEAAGAFAPAPAPAASSRRRREVRAKRSDVTRLAVVEPRVRRGSAYPIGDEITFGRAATCTITMPDDTFVSQLHARLFRRDGAVWVDDLGSTNGTYVNGRKLTTAEQLAKGDRLQIGNTIFEAQ